MTRVPGDIPPFWAEEASSLRKKLNGSLQSRRVYRLANCAGQTHLFFPPDIKFRNKIGFYEESGALELCRECKVREECLEMAIDDCIWGLLPYGMQGAKLPREIREDAKKYTEMARKSAAPGEIARKKRDRQRIYGRGADQRLQVPPPEDNSVV